MVFFDFNEKALQKGSNFDVLKNVEKSTQKLHVSFGDFFDAIASMCLKLRVLGFLSF
jgi:hypothetical protein